MEGMVAALKLFLPVPAVPTLPTLAASPATLPLFTSLFMVVTDRLLPGLLGLPLSLATA